MKKIVMLALMMLITSSFSLGYAPRLAVINCPVADLVGKPLAESNEIYKKLPLFADTNQTPRIHQALFNEVVKIVDETRCEYCIEISNAYFVTDKNKSPQTRYWTSKKNCTILDDAMKTCIPAPISYKKSFPKNRPTLVLIKPWHDARTGNSYSVGTRFIYCPKASDDEIKTIMLYDFIKKKSTLCGIHHSECRIEVEPRSPNAARTDMICMIREWIGAHYQPVVPYVWGGCSYVYRYHGTFKQKRNTEYMYRRTHHTPHTGFDCSCLILRAAQCMELPFFCKNSYTASQKLKEVHTYHDIEVGDIIWIPGHVMLIADLECNTIIEARGYPHGYGKLQETPIAEQFEGIKTIKQLVEHLNAKKSLKRLNKKGTVVTTIPHYKILKLC
jgi:hypothetical protein